jgi:hypothetical protein
MSRWTGHLPIPPAQRKARKREYDRARKLTRRAAVRPQQLAESTTLPAPLEKPTVTFQVTGPRHGIKIAVIPDAQVQADVPIDHLAACGQYLALKRPEVIVCIGDFADMPSLSTYLQAGSLESEGLRYKDDVAAVRRAMTAFLKPIRAKRGYDPKLIMTYGNHEDRISRTLVAQPRLFTGSLDDLGYEADGWTTYPFLQPVVVAGVAFSHYFPSGVMGRPITTAAALLRKMHMSAFAGHLQGRDIAYSKRADGSSLTAIIAGSFYQHNEGYLSPFTNKHWRGMYMLHEVKNGTFDEMAISVNYLLRRFG